MYLILCSQKLTTSYNLLDPHNQRDKLKVLLTCNASGQRLSPSKGKEKLMRRDNTFAKFRLLMFLVAILVFTVIATPSLLAGATIVESISTEVGSPPILCSMQLVATSSTFLSESTSEATTMTTGITIDTQRTSTSVVVRFWMTTPATATNPAGQIRADANITNIISVAPMTAQNRPVAMPGAPRKIISAAHPIPVADLNSRDHQLG